MIYLIVIAVLFAGNAMAQFGEGRGVDDHYCSCILTL